MRISIREQLGILVLICSLMGLMVLALAVWFQNFNFITGIRISGLALTASLKAAQVTSTLLLYQSQCQSVTTRVLVQSALTRYIQGTFSLYDVSPFRTAQNWVRAQADLSGALGNGNLLVQAALFPSVDVGNQSAISGLLNVTADGKNGTAIELPYNYPNGNPVYLGNDEYGYPPTLYPNITYSANTSNTSADAFYQGKQLDPHNVLVLGPLLVNESYALLSATIGVINNTSRRDVLGWLTVVVDASMIFNIQNSPEGLGETGQTLLIGSTHIDNLFESDPRNASADAVKDREVRFVLPPNEAQQRHSAREPASNSMLPFRMSSFPAVVSAWTKRNDGPNNAGAYISTNNEQGQEISAGYATLATSFVDWVLVIEQSHQEVVTPINHLRNVVLICVFSVMGGLLLTIFPLAHYSITPIRQLRAATQKTVEPYQPEDGSMYSGSGYAYTNTPSEEENVPDAQEAKKEGFLGLAQWTGSQSRSQRRLKRRMFRIPSKVPERKHFITDELTDLTSTFNEMADELTMQYERLEERVKERTAELERSKQAAESANQSKTLFIANISHELKTPLNGILGLTTVCMAEDDMTKIRSTLSTIYKSGDLLLHLLTDLLTFSKNEVGQQLAIDEAEFRLNDLSTQLVPTFEKQAREAQVELKVLYLGTSDAFGDASDFSGDKLYGPSGTGRVRDMCLWGDKNRILQVLMNFVSNSLKFTPAHGSVIVRIRCVGLLDHFPDRSAFARKSSTNSRRSKGSSSKRVRMSDASLSASKEQSDSLKPNPNPDPEKTHANSHSGEEGKLSINVAGGTAQIPKVAERRRSMSPPPQLNTKDLAFEFEVEDTGPGIPESQQKKIFEPFVQGDLGLSKKYGGTGLGLSICVQLASLMGGDVSLDSKVGKGSKFTMKIPLRFLSERAASMASSHRSHSKASSLVGQSLHDDSDHHLHHPRGGSTTSLSSTQDDKHRQSSMLADVPRIVGFSAPYVAKETKPENAAKARINEMKKAESEAAKQGKKVRVLVAEDNPVNQEVVLRMLKLEDVYDVTIAKDGQEAFDTVRDSMGSGNKFDLVFMDVQMPNLDGIQSTKLIREMGFSAPIVALTAFAEKSNEDECMASGMDYFLAKPIRRPALKQVLKKYCATIPEEDGEGTPMPVMEDLQDDREQAIFTNGVRNEATEDDDPPASSTDDVSPLS